MKRIHQNMVKRSGV